MTAPYVAIPASEIRPGDALLRACIGAPTVALRVQTAARVLRVVSEGGVVRATVEIAKHGGGVVEATYTYGVGALALKVEE